MRYAPSTIQIVFTFLSLRVNNQLYRLSEFWKGLRAKQLHRSIAGEIQRGFR
jgi:hypothetical protein